MKIDRISALTINCPEFFARPDFQTWLNGVGMGNSQRATWHTLGAAPTEYSDTFITYDASGTRFAPVSAANPESYDVVDGSDFDTLFPDDIKRLLVDACQALGFEQGIIRFTNEGGGQG